MCLKCGRRKNPALNIVANEPMFSDTVKPIYFKIHFSENMASSFGPICLLVIRAKF